MTNAEMQMANLREKIGDKTRADFVEDALNFWRVEPVKFESNAGFSFKNKFGEPVIYAKSFDDIFARRNNAYLAAAEMMNRWYYYCAGVCKERGIRRQRSNDPCVAFYASMKETFKAIIEGIQSELYGGEK